MEIDHGLHGKEHLGVEGEGAHFNEGYNEEEHFGPCKKTLTSNCEEVPVERRGINYRGNVG